MLPAAKTLHRAKVKPGSRNPIAPQQYLGFERLAAPRQQQSLEILNHANEMLGSKNPQLRRDDIRR